MRTPLILAAVLFAMPAFAEPTAADRESARSAFAEGNQLRDGGKVREALEKYKAAYALAPTPVTALEVGRAQADLGQLVEARETLLGVERLPEAPTDSAKSKASRAEARDVAAKVAQRIPRLSIRVLGDAEGVVVSVDGNTVPREALVVPRSINPGRHAVMAVVNGRTVQQTLDVREGEARDVTLDVRSLTAQSTPLAVLQTTPTQPANAATSGIVAFNTPDDGHAWTLQSANGQKVCNLPCTYSIGFSNGYSLMRDDGVQVHVPGGLAVVPGSAAQVEPHGSAGSLAAGWIVFTAGTAATVAGLVLALVGAGSFNVSTGSSNEGATIGGLVMLGAGAVVATVGIYILAFSHGPILVRTDLGTPMRVAHEKPTLRIGLSPLGIAGSF